MNRVDAFLDLLLKQNGSDLHLVSGNPPRIRLYGEIHPVKYRDLTEDETKDLLFEIMPDRVKTIFQANGGADFGYELTGTSRFRVNVFRHRDGIGAVFRAIPEHIATLDELKMPPVLKVLTRQRKGLILVSGPTGSGKSTTLAAMIDFINTERKGHIITIEDPVEHVHKYNGCLISQREVGEHTDSFASALRSALREDPDVVLVGELRDLETISLAVTAAEMGILILATLHTNGAAAAVDRIINVFPPGEEPYIRSMLSTSLCGVISQQLVKIADNRGRLAAVETLINNSAASNIIREGKTEQLETVIQGMQSIDMALRRLLDEKLITGEEAYRKARLKSNFEQYREQDEPIHTTTSTFL
jgi:twitching motility protein PilT